MVASGCTVMVTFVISVNRFPFSSGLFRRDLMAVAIADFFVDAVP